MALTSPWRCPQGLHAPTLSDTERRALFRDGFIVLRRVVDAEAAAAARDIVLHPELRGDQRELFYHDAIVKLYTEGRLSAILDDVMGPHTRPIASQVALTPNGQGYPGEDPAHVDGGWAGEHPQSVGDILASGQTLETWGTQDSPKSLGPAGFAPLWQDPEMKSAIGSFMAFAGVCLSDQTKPDSGQFSVHRGAHDGVEAFFRRQRDAGGPLGGGGPFWPRLIQHSVPPGHPLSDKAFAGVMPEAMRAGYPDEGKLTPVMMEPGDGVITLHAIPHAATMNRNEEPRINVYWRAPRTRPVPLLRFLAKLGSSYHGCCARQASDGCGSRTRTKATQLSSGASRTTPTGRWTVASSTTPPRPTTTHLRTAARSCATTGASGAGCRTWLPSARARAGPRGCEWANATR